jgi:hypothetical protein
MKNHTRITKVIKPKVSAEEKRAEKQAEKQNHPLLNSPEWRGMNLPSVFVWGAAQMDPWVLGSDGAVQSAFKKIADAIWHEGSDHVDDLVIHTVSYSLLFFIYSDWLFQLMQRLSDTWRAPVGSAALMILHAYFESQRRGSPTIQSTATRK